MNVKDIVWREKYRPQKFEDLIFEGKDLLSKYLEKKESIPSFIFSSSKPGTGKTSTAKLISKHLGADTIIINSSDERGIDTIRDKIKDFARSLSSNETKRLIFLDEADGLTRPAQDSLRNLMETYTDNCFFIFSCNDVSKLIEPIRSRCVEMHFGIPDAKEIKSRLEYICKQEKLECNIDRVIEKYYPDIRSMVKSLQMIKLTGCDEVNEEEKYAEFLGYMRTKNIAKIQEKVYAKSFDFMGFNKWIFDYLFKNWEKAGLTKISQALNCLADTEKHYNLGVNLQVIFVNNVLKIIEILWK